MRFRKSTALAAASLAMTAGLAVLAAGPAGAAAAGTGPARAARSVGPAANLHVETRGRALTHGPRATYGSGFSTSSNWSGWADTGESYTWITSTWTVPSVSCGAGENSSSVVWDGLDGYANSTVEQIGTYQGCRNGSANYSAWWEMFTTAYNSPEVTISSSQPSKPDGMQSFTWWGDSSTYTVRPGDSMDAWVSNPYGGSTYYLYLINATENWYFLAEVTPPSNWRPSGSGQDTSAEWIVELPSNWVGNTLSHYSMVTFTNAEAEGNGTEGPINAFPNGMIWMTSTGGSNGYLMALTSWALPAGGETFNDGWVNS